MSKKLFQHPDFHIHSHCSDGSDSPRQLLNRIRQTDIDFFALTDHDTFEGCRIIQENLEPEDALFVPGVEFGCAEGKDKYHILGYGFDCTAQPIRQAVEITHNARREKFTRRLTYLRELGYEFPREQVEAMLALSNPGRPHLAKLLVENGFSPNYPQAYAILANYRGKGVVLTPEEAIRAIRASGGIAVLAHGILADGSRRLSEEDITARVEHLLDLGIQGLEGYYPTYTKAQTEIMLGLAKRFDLLVSAGSDYHGTNKTVPLGQTGGADPETLEPFCHAVQQRTKTSE